MSERVDVLVIGGGIVGVSCAYYLAECGRRPVVVERDEVCSLTGSTYANAGLIVPSDVEPLAAPGTLGRGRRWMLDGSSPFWFRPRLCRHQWRWLNLFRSACTEVRFLAGMRPLRELSLASSNLFDELAAVAGPDMTLRRNGWLVVHEERAAHDEALAFERHARSLGVLSETLTPPQLRERVPQLPAHVVGGVFNKENAHVLPDRCTLALADRARALGAEFRSGTEVLNLDADGGPRRTGGPASHGVCRSGSRAGTTRSAPIRRVVTTRGVLEPETVVLAAGAWSPHLTRPLGFDLPVQPAKGYSVTVPRPRDFPELPLYLAERHVCITPMEDTIRMAGTLELSGYDTTMRPRRLRGLVRGAAALLGPIAEQEPLLLWRGPRPLSPDGLPFIGRSPRHENLVIATGHCMIGLSLGPATGKVVAQLVAGEEPAVDLRAFAPQRFEPGRTSDPAPGVA